MTPKIVEYEFSPPDSALTSPYRASAPVRVHAACERTHVGQAVVVLYDPRAPLPPPPKSRL